MEEHAFQLEAVDLAKLKSIQCDPKCSAHDLEDDDEHDGPSGILTVEDVPTTLAPGRDENSVKVVMRNSSHDFKSPLRSYSWKALYLRLEAIAGSTTDPLNAQSLADATAGLYRDTLETCFGTQGSLQLQKFDGGSGLKRWLNGHYNVNGAKFARRRTRI